MSGSVEYKPIIGQADSGLLKNAILASEGVMGRNKLLLSEIARDKHEMKDKRDKELSKDTTDYVNGSIALLNPKINDSEKESITSLQNSIINKYQGQLRDEFLSNVNKQNVGLVVSKLNTPEKLKSKKNKQDDRLK